jgi:gluconolactonase
MHSYAQTNVQLFNQLRRDGFTKADLDLVRDAYQLAMVLFSGRFQPSGKSFMAHVVGTASILGSLRLPTAVVAAGLLHNVYEQRDFGDGRKSISISRRRKIRRVLGPDVEECVARFSTLSWQWPTNLLARENPQDLASIDRAVLSIILADHLEHLLDLDVLYYGHTVQRRYLDNSKIAVEVANRLSLCELAAEMREAIRRTEFAQLPVEIPEDRSRSFVIAPKSCRMRFPPVLRQGLMNRTRKARKEILKRLKSVYQKLPYEIKAPLDKRRGKRKLLGGGLAIKSEEFRGLFPKDASPARIATGFRFVEGPVWIEEEKRLLFSDIPADRIFGLTPDGRVTVFRKPSGSSNGLTRDKEGLLIACEHSNRRVTRTEKDRSITVLAERFQGKRLNSPNDVIVKSDGAIYFTDPSYGIKCHEQEQPVQGVYRLSPDGSELSLVADDFIRPNGLAFSPDEKKLYIDDSERRHIRVFNVKDDGLLSGGTVFHDMVSTIPGSPDGMKVDVEGRVYCTGAGGVWVFDSNGRHLGTIVTPEKPSNCAWGGDDWGILYITANSSIYTIRVCAPGVPLLCGS